MLNLVMVIKLEHLNPHLIDRILEETRSIFPNDTNDIFRELSDSVRDEKLSHYVTAHIKGSTSEVDGLVGVNIDNDNKLAWLGWFFLKKEYRNQGFGSVMLKYCKNLAKDNDMNFLCSWTTSVEVDKYKIDQFYKKHDFTETLSQEKYKKSDVYLYHLKINADQKFKIPQKEKWLY